MSGSSSSGTWTNSTGHVIGSAERMATSNNPRALKNLSMSEKLKLAEEQARVVGVGAGRRLTEYYPRAKRIAVSDIALRHKAVALTVPNDQVDSNDEFFENLMKKMKKEQFMPANNDLRSQKRTCVWNKENLIQSGTTKRQKKSNKKSGMLTVPDLVSFARRLLPSQTDADDPLPVIKKLQTQGDRILPRKKLTFNLIHEDISMRDLNSNRFCESSLNSTRSINESFSENLTADDSVFNIKNNIFKQNLRDSSVNNVDLSPDHDHVCKKKYPNNLWTSPCLSTIEECYEPSRTDVSPTIDTIGTECASDVCFTPPLQTESDDYLACHIDKEAEDDFDDLRFLDVNLFS